jgi:DNA primase
VAIPQTFIQEVLARVDVVDIVGRYVQLKKGGANFMGLCPFHGEKSPSFSVSPTKQFYHCFGCGKNGNAIGFLMDHAGMTFVEAVHDLAQQHGMQVPEEDGSAQDRELALRQREKQSSLSDVMQRASEGYIKHLKESPKAVAYLKGRGLSGQVAKIFKLGYAPAGWRNLASIFPSYDDPLLVESGMVIANAEEGSDEKRYDRFRDRVMFPIRGIKGDIIGFGGRVLGDEKPKYLNSPETPVFSKGRELYGLYEARKSLRDHGYVLVTEGYMDVVALAQLGFPNTVATLGTACTTDHVQKLFRFTDSVVFSFDGDAAGRRAARKALDAALPFATDVRSVKFLFLPPEHDPDTYIREFGSEGFSQQIARAVPLSRFMVDAAREGCDLTTAEGRAHLASNGRSLWVSLPEGAFKQQMLSEFSELVQLSSGDLSDLWLPLKSSKQSDTLGSEVRPGGSNTRKSGPALSRLPKAGTLRGRDVESIPNGRADHAARLILTHMALLGKLNTEELELLVGLPSPHGMLFSWLEGRLHECGVQPWVVLSQGLADHPTAPLAHRLMAADTPVNEDNVEDAYGELRNILGRMLAEHLKKLETAAIIESASDPSATLRYLEIQNRRRKLETGGESARHSGKG